MPEGAAPISVDVHVCESCGAVYGTRPFRCETCGSDALSLQAIAGTGSLFTWTVVRRPPDAFAGAGPMTVGLVDIDAGPRLTVSLDSLDVEPKLGARVKITAYRNGIPHCILD